MADHKFRPEIEVLSAGDVPRRRHWSDADKIRIVEESFLGHRQVTATARRHGVSRSLLTIWRRQYRSGELGDETSPVFIPLAVSPKSAAAAPVAPGQVVSDAEAQISTSEAVFQKLADIGDKSETLKQSMFEMTRLEERLKGIIETCGSLVHRLQPENRKPDR